MENMSKILVRSNFLQFREMLRGNICYCVLRNTSLENSQSVLPLLPQSPPIGLWAWEASQLISSKKDASLPCPCFKGWKRTFRCSLCNTKESLNWIWSLNNKLDGQLKAEFWCQEGGFRLVRLLRPAVKKFSRQKKKKKVLKTVMQHPQG